MSFTSGRCFFRMRFRGIYVRSPGIVSASPQWYDNAHGTGLPTVPAVDRRGGEELHRVLAPLVRLLPMRAFLVSLVSEYEVTRRLSASCFADSVFDPRRRHGIISTAVC